MPVAHFNLILLRRGEKEAKRHFLAVLQSDPQDDEARLYLGGILLREKDYDAAIFHLAKAAGSSRGTVHAAAAGALRTARELKAAAP